LDSEAKGKQGGQRQGRSPTFPFEEIDEGRFDNLGGRSKFNSDNFFNQGSRTFEWNLIGH
jgi:hypothetical protein